MRYLLGYFALTVGLSGLSLLAAGQALGFPLLLVAAVLIYLIVRIERARRRERRFGDYAGAIEGYERRLAEGAKALEAKLPEEGLDSPALVELLSAYEHEDADEADAIREEYLHLRERFVDWQEDFDRMRAQSGAGAIGLPERFAEHYDELDRRLSALGEEVERLEARAAEAGRAAEDPLEEIARAALKLEQVESTCRSSFAGAVPDELRSQLAVAAGKLGQAREALAKGAERPLAATRLARAVYDLAIAVERRADELVRRPAEVGAERAGLERECVRVEGEIAQAKSKLGTAAELYAPACLLEIRGLGAAAEQALERARALTAKQTNPGDDVPLGHAKESLERADDLVKRIGEHLAAIERAAQAARHDVEEAELAVDRAWAGVTTGSPSHDVLHGAERIVSRARDLATQARAEIEQLRPDWFRATSLAKRATDLVSELSPARAPIDECPLPGSPANVGHARA
jgi:hypothetical protein